jgi:hypothetical protein
MVAFFEIISHSRIEIKKLHQKRIKSPIQKVFLWKMEANHPCHLTKIKEM